MKAFKFTLEKYMDVKVDEESTLKKKLKAIDKNISDMQAKMDAFTQEERQKKERFTQECQKGMQASDLHQYSAYFSYLYEAKKEVRKDLELAHTERETCRQELVTVLNEVKALGKMRERQLQEYNEQIKQEENKVIDEFVSYQVYSS